MKKFKYILPPVLVAAGIFFVSHQPNVSLPNMAMEFNDKLLHFIGYLVFGTTILFALNNTAKDMSRARQFFILFLIGTIYAVSDEFHQKLVPGRTFEIADIVADSIGILSSFFIEPYLRKIYYYYRKSNV